VQYSCHLRTLTVEQFLYHQLETIVCIVAILPFSDMMAPSALVVQSHGIFHGLPTFPGHDGKKYSAIVTGANGISGSHLVEILSKSPERWGNIFALSRKPPSTKSPNVHSIAVDFLSTEPEEIARVLADNHVEAFVNEIFKQ